MYIHTAKKSMNTWNIYEKNVSNKLFVKLLILLIKMNIVSELIILNHKRFKYINMIFLHN